MKLLSTLSQLVSRRKFRGASIGEGTIIYRSVSVRNPHCVQMGHQCFIGPDSRIEAWDEYAGDNFDPRIVFGDRVRIHSKCHIGAIDSIVVGSDTLLGADVFITDHSHGHVTFGESSMAPTDRPLYSKGPVVLGERVWVGERAIILPGVTVGDGAVIGAGSVVTHDVPANSVAVGNPARVVRIMTQDEAQ